MNHRFKADEDETIAQKQSQQVLNINRSTLMDKTASLRKFPQPLSNQIKAFHDDVKHSHLRVTVMNHLKDLNR